MKKLPLRHHLHYPFILLGHVVWFLSETRPFIAQELKKPLKVNCFKSCLPILGPHQWNQGRRVLSPGRVFFKSRPLIDEMDGWDIALQPLSAEVQDPHQDQFSQVEVGAALIHAEAQVWYNLSQFEVSFRLFKHHGTLSKA